MGVLDAGVGGGGVVGGGGGVRVTIDAVGVIGGNVGGGAGGVLDPGRRCPPRRPGASGQAEAGVAVLPLLQDQLAASRRVPRRRRRHRESSGGQLRVGFGHQS